MISSEFFHGSHSVRAPVPFVLESQSKVSARPVHAVPASLAQILRNPDVRQITRMQIWGRGSSSQAHISSQFLLLSERPWPYPAANLDRSPGAACDHTVFTRQLVNASVRLAARGIQDEARHQLSSPKDHPKFLLVSTRSSPFYKNRTDKPLQLPLMSVTPNEYNGHRSETVT
eukprot:543167-Hanusia_phi.AAC.3